MKGTSDGSKGSPGISKRWLNALTMAGSHGSAETANTSAASIKSARQTVLGSALGKVERSIRIPISPIRVEGMSHEDAYAEQEATFPTTTSAARSQNSHPPATLIG